MLKQTRENFALGADYIKIMIGGGVSSEKDPLHSLQFTPSEIEAAVAVSVVASISPVISTIVTKNFGTLQAKR